MKNNKGFISTSIIYSFFVVFILLMLAMLLNFINKRILIKKLPDLPADNLCLSGDELRYCLLKYENLDKKYSLTYSSSEIKSGIDNRTIPDFSIVSISDEGMYATADDYGTSYYYRGAVEDNYVVFANYVWRVVRINGNGSIRMIYEGTYNPDGTDSKVTGNNYIDASGTKFNYTSFAEIKDSIGYSLFDDNINKCNDFKNNFEQKVSECKDACITNYCRSHDWVCRSKIEVKRDAYCGISTIGEDLVERARNRSAGAYMLIKSGYMHGDYLSVYYDAKYANNDDSLIKKLVDDWYEDKIIGNNRNYLDNGTIFCGSKNRIGHGTENGENCKFLDVVKKESGCDITQYYYEAWSRYNMGGTYKYDNIKLVCPETGTIANIDEHQALNLSNYNTNGQVKTKTNGVAEIGNGALKYPIGLLSADEMIMAGGTLGTENKNFYLYKDNSPFWSMTLSYSDYATNLFSDDSEQKIGTRYFILDNAGKVAQFNDKWKDNKAHVRPVINLASTIKYCNGEGTKNKPFVISNGTCS